MTDKKPWDYHPDLTAERLIQIAELIVHGRNAALDRYDPAIGDDGWTLGCLAYAYGRFRILEAHDGGALPWLGIIDRSLRFIFRIGDVPIRFYRGTADEPSGRTLRQAYPEIHQIQLSFDLFSPGRGLLYRFAVETDLDGSVLRVIFVGLNGDIAELSWEIPMSSAVRPIFSVDEQMPEGVELDAPAVDIPGEQEVADREGEPEAANDKNQSEKGSEANDAG